MATPVGHALCGIAVGSLVAGKRPFLSPGWDLLLFAALAMAPDFDFLPGLLIGQLEAFHHGLSHSLGAALLAGVMGALAGWRWGSPWRWGLTVGLVYFAQVALDWVTIDTSFPYGVPLWWPLSPDYTLGPGLLSDVRRSPFGWGIIWHDLKAAGWEALWLGPPAAILGWLRMRGAKQIP